MLVVVGGYFVWMISDFGRVLICEKLEIKVIYSSSVHYMEPEVETKKTENMNNLQILDVYET
jgi:hypothetical protein